MWPEQGSPDPRCPCSRAEARREPRGAASRWCRRRPPETPPSSMRRRGPGNRGRSFAARSRLHRTCPRRPSAPGRREARDHTSGRRYLKTQYRLDGDAADRRARGRGRARSGAREPGSTATPREGAPEGSDGHGRTLGNPTRLGRREQAHQRARTSTVGCSGTRLERHAAGRRARGRGRTRSSAQEPGSTGTPRAGAPEGEDKHGRALRNPARPGRRGQGRGGRRRTRRRTA